MTGDSNTFSPQDLAALLRTARHSMCWDKERPDILGALLSLDGEKMSIVTTDGHRLTKCSRPLKSAPHDPFLIPAEGVEGLIAVLQQECKRRFVLRRDAIAILPPISDRAAPPRVVKVSLGESLMLEMGTERLHEFADPFVVGFNADYLREAFEALNSIHVKLEFADSPLDHCVIRPVDSEDTVILLMPMRI